jgi:hypothetical protein
MNEPNNATDDSITNTGGGTLISIKLGEEERRALRWVTPLLIACGFNLAATVIMIVFWHNADTDALLVYSHQVRCEAWLDAHGFAGHEAYCKPVIVKP